MNDEQLTERTDRLLGVLELGAIGRKAALDAMKPFGVHSYRVFDEVLHAAKQEARRRGAVLYTYTRPTEYELRQA